MAIQAGTESHRWVGGIAIGYCSVIIAIILLLGLCPSSCHSWSHETGYNKKKSEDNLKQLFILMTMYANDNSNRYPSMQPPGSTTNGGVRDLYPLYRNMSDRRKFLELLRPPRMRLVPFSANPGPDEFDRNHIGYMYNSTIVPHPWVDNDTGQWANVPLMAERGVSDGVLTKKEGPAFSDGAHVLLANGDIRWLQLTGTNLSLGDIKFEDLMKLKQ